MILLCAIPVTPSNGVTFLSAYPPHIQQRIRIPLSVKFCPPVDMEPHVLIKSTGVRVLFVDSQVIDKIGIYPVFYQLTAQALPPFLWGKKKHFKRLPLYSHEAARDEVPIRCDNQMRYRTQRLRDILTDLTYLLI